MPAIHLAHAVGGDLMKGFIAAVAFATILAVVSGLTLVGRERGQPRPLRQRVPPRPVSTRRRRSRVSRITTVVLGIVAILLGIVFEKINVAFMVGLAFAVAASANFPVLLLSMLWKGLTTRGAFIGGFVGLISAVVLTIVSPAIWEAVLGYPKGAALFPYVVAGDLHHAAGVPVLLDVLGHRQVGVCGARSGRPSRRSTSARRRASARRALRFTERCSRFETGVRLIGRAPFRASLISSGGGVRWLPARRAINISVLLFKAAVKGGRPPWILSSAQRRSF